VPASQPRSAVLSVAGNLRQHRTLKRPKPSPTPTSTPCANKTTAAIAPTAVPWLPVRGPISQVSAQLAAVKVTTVAAARLNRHLAS
jgi:hypothetical protein